jgi:hypothetical protein
MHHSKSPASYAYYEFSQTKCRPSAVGQTLDQFKQDPDSSINRKLLDEDRDLKDIIETKQYYDSLQWIKFLSELPLMEINKSEYFRRHHLQRHLHMLIQENLRQSI